MKFKYLAIYFVLLCCVIGTASAVDNASIDALDDTVDDALIVDTLIDDASDFTAAEETHVDTAYDDTATEGINEELSIEKEKNDVELSCNRSNWNPDPGIGISVKADNWNLLKTYSELTGVDCHIALNGTSYIPTSQINFRNSATIIGTENSYITGTFNDVPFLNTNNDLTITFRNVKFRDMNVENLLELAGTNVFENCSFYNITAATGHNAVIYNTYGNMSLIGCNITNSSAGYGVVSNYNSATVTDVLMNVDSCKFINNSASVEPGAINNCGILFVNDSEFINNTAAWWAGAIHTHYNAQTTINNSNFTGNVAGWNGGALYTYSSLKIYNTNFRRNKCYTDTGGGAIGASRWWSGNYDIIIENCTFEKNENCHSSGYGGAITAMNSGSLDVHNSTFINNTATNGQAISAYSKEFENISAGIPNLKIYGNNFYNHTLTTSDTVEISGNYSFENNTFTNCHQTNLGTNNVFIDPVLLTNSNGLILQEGNMRSSKNSLTSSVLKDSNMHDIIYVNESCDNNPLLPNIDGQSWETAFGTSYLAFPLAYSYINNNGIIYLADGNYGDKNVDNRAKNVTFIGQSKDVIFNSLTTIGTGNSDMSATATFINLTVYYADLFLNSNFINCTFVNSHIDIAEGIAQIEHLDEKPYGVTHNITFNNCEFKDYNIESSIFTVYKYGRVVLTNCTFDNIIANSIVARSGDFIDQDEICLYDCKFTNCNIKGVLDIPGDIEILEFCAIENCDYDFDATTDIAMVDEYAHNYLNATKLKVVAVDSIVDISSSEKGVVVVTLTDNSTSPIASATFKFSVNGGNEQTGVTGDDGKFTITGLTGEVIVEVTYDGNESFNPISGNKFFNFTEEHATNDTTGTNESNSTPVPPAKVATKLTAHKVTATYNVAEKLVITLTDKNGKFLVNKKVTVKVGSISKTLTTNSKGQVRLNVARLLPKTYTASIKFAGDSIYAASSASPKVVVSKAKPKIAAKAKTFKVKAKTKKFTASLKNNKGKALKKVKLTLKVGKKTYKATTNSKGVATFK
ncbi:MAG: hypothetical protein E7Z75_06375, partial [Methanobrevibacter olleyae]|nr:hypothetical protein [Methanobrevibacter olleyae]